MLIRVSDARSLPDLQRNLQAACCSSKGAGLWKLPLTAQTSGTQSISNVSGRLWSRDDDSEGAGQLLPVNSAGLLLPLYLRIVQLQGCLAAKNLDHHLEFTLLAVDFLDHSGKSVEGTVVDLDSLTDYEVVDTVDFAL